MKFLEELYDNIKAAFPYFDNILALLFGFGLFLMVVHNPKLSEYTTPTTGMKILLATSPVLVLKAIVSKPKIDWRLLAAMSVILLFAGIQFFGKQLHFLNNLIIVDKSAGWLSPVIFAGMCLGVYFIAKTNERMIAYSAAIFTVLASASVVYVAFSTGLKSGGWVNPQNYDVIIPVLAIGCLISPQKWRWMVSAVSVVGFFFSGAEIGLFVLFFVLLAVIIRRDFSRKLLAPFGALLLCLLVATPFGITQKLWLYNDVQGTLGERVQAGVQTFNGGNLNEFDYLVTGNRITGNWNIRPVTLLGHGLEIDKLTEETPHNQFLIMTDQIGIIAAIAWLVATFVWAKKTRNWYLFAVFMSVGMLDHFFWTAGILLWWAVVGFNAQGRIFTKS